MDTFNNTIPGSPEEKMAARRAKLEALKQNGAVAGKYLGLFTLGILATIGFEKYKSRKIVAVAE